MERANNNTGNVNYNILSGEDGCTQLPSNEGKPSLLEQGVAIVAKAGVLLISMLFNKKIVKEETPDRGGCFGTGDMSKPETYTPDA